MFPAELQKQYQSHKYWRRYLARSEIEIDDWGWYNSTADEYTHLFAQVLEGKTLFALAAEIKQRKGRLVGIDFCGQGDFLTELGVDIGLSVCLGHNFRHCQPASATLDKWDADLMENETWIRIDGWVYTNGKPDLIVCAPLGGHRTFWDWGREQISPSLSYFGYQHSREIFFILVNKMTQMLADGGTLLVEFKYNHDLKSWVNQVETLNSLPDNLSVDIRAGVLRITKVPPLANRDTSEHKIIEIG